MGDHPERCADRGVEAFAGRVVVVLLLGSLTLVAWRLSAVALLLFAAVLMAIALRGTAWSFARLAGIGGATALAFVVILFLTGLGLALWFFGTVIGGQLDELARQVPAGLRTATGRLQSHPYGRYALEQAQGLGTAGMTGWAAAAVGNVARALTRGLGYAVLTFFVAIYLAAQPGRYRRICLQLIPPDSRPRAARLFEEAGNILRRWLLGQAVVMATVGTLSGIGLWALGIEAAFALGLVGGLLTFIPFVGAVLAAVPATLVALTQGPGFAVLVVLMYIGVHVVEGNVITPMVQAEATALPPVLSLLSTVAFSILFGPSAVLLAAPLTLLLLVVIKVLYVEQALGAPASLSEGSAPEHSREFQPEARL